MDIEKDTQTYSSFPAIVMGDQDPEFTVEQFIAMDPPKHDSQRKAVTAAVSPKSLSQLEPVIRRRVAGIMSELPVGEPFDWVERVSIELTTQMLARLFDFPFERRSKLTFWSDMATSSEQIAGDDSVSAADRQAALQECLAEFTAIWQDRAQQSLVGKSDLLP